MTETKKRTRAPKQLTQTEIMMQLEKLLLHERVTIFTALKSSIEEERKLLLAQIEHINVNVK